MMIELWMLILMVVAAIWSVMARSLLKSAISLATVSAILCIFMFRFDAPLAGVFELSVCTGLITVIFLSTIGLTKPMSHKEILAESKDRGRRYGLLPIITILAGILALGLINLPIDFKAARQEMIADARSIMWNLRQLDLFGQIIMILAGVFGTVLLFKEIELDEW